MGHSEINTGAVDDFEVGHPDLTSTNTRIIHTLSNLILFLGDPVV